MAKKCEELDLVAIWDDSEASDDSPGKFELRCTRTRKSITSTECEQYAANDTVDIAQVAAELALMAGGSQRKQ